MNENFDLKEVLSKYKSKIIFIIILVFSLPYLLTRDSWLEGMDFRATGQIGDTIGGTTAPIIGLLTALLTFIAFYVQFEFNKSQNKRIDKQEEDIRKDRFENHFFELIKMHRENINEISIKDFSKGRRAFVSMFREYKFCYLELERIVNESRIEINEKEIANISFVVFMYGVGDTSSGIIEDIFSARQDDLVTKYLNQLEIHRQLWGYNSGNIKSPTVNIPKTGIGTVEVKNIRDKRKNLTLTVGYTPVDGHLSRLTHYYRLLFNIVDYIHSGDFLSIQERRSFVDLVVSQMSDYEQLLLYYFSLSVLGEQWTKSNDTTNYILQYNILSHIPISLTKFGCDIEKNYPREYFQWHNMLQANLNRTNNNNP